MLCRHPAKDLIPVGPDARLSSRPSSKPVSETGLNTPELGPGHRKTMTIRTPESPVARIVVGINAVEDRQDLGLSRSTAVFISLL